MCTEKAATSEEPSSQTMDTEEPEMKKEEENKVENKRKKVKEKITIFFLRKNFQIVYFRATMCLMLTR